MKLNLHTPPLVTLESLSCGDYFVKSRKDGTFSSVYQKVTMPHHLGGYTTNHEEQEAILKPLNGFVYYVEVWCGWVYSYTREEAQTRMVYKVIPVTGALELKFDLDIKLNVGG